MNLLGQGVKETQVLEAKYTDKDVIASVLSMVEGMARGTSENVKLGLFYIEMGLGRTPAKTAVPMDVFTSVVTVLAAERKVEVPSLVNFTRTQVMDAILYAPWPELRDRRGEKASRSEKQISRAIADAKAYQAQQVEIAADNAAKEFEATSGVTIPADESNAVQESRRAAPRGTKGIFIFGFKRCESSEERQVWINIFTRGAGDDRLAKPSDVKTWAGLAQAELKEAADLAAIAATKGETSETETTDPLSAPISKAS